MSELIFSLGNLSEERLSAFQLQVPRRSGTGIQWADQGAVPWILILPEICKLVKNLTHTNSSDCQGHNWMK